jgi:hypothetical protein
VANIKYVFSDFRTSTILYELPMRGVRLTTKLNDWGSFNGTFSLDMTGHQNIDLVNCTLPGKSCLTVERDDRPIWDGIVWGRTYHSQAKAIQLTARTREAYLEKVDVPVDFSRTDYEQRNIVRDLFLLLQTSSNTNFNLTIPSAFSDVVLKSLEILATDKKNFLQAISAITDGDNGFDWTIATSKSGSGYIRTLRIGYPTLGSVTAGITFDYPGNITEYYKSETMTPAGTHIFVLGAGEGSLMPVGTYVHTDMIANGWMEYDVNVARKDLTEQAQVDDFASRLGVVRRPPFTTLKAFVKADKDPVFGSYNLGDLVQVAIIDPRHPEGVTAPARLVAMAYWPPSNDGVERAELIFEGDELNDG